MKRSLAFLTLLAFALGTSAGAQQFLAAGVYEPLPFAQWSIRVDGQPNTAAGSTTITMPVNVTIAGGPAFEPLATSVPVAVVDGASSETLKPSSVSCAAGSCTVTFTYTNPHLGSYYLTSGDAGLQEAVNYAVAQGGGMVAIGPRCAACTVSGLTAGATSVAVEDFRAGVALYGWTGSAYAQRAALASGNWQSSCSGTTAAMTAGAITVTNSCLVAGRPVTLTEVTKGGTQGTLSYVLSAGSLAISSSSSTDTSTVAWVQN